MKKLLKYDFQYLRKTSKFIVFGAILVLFSIISPLTARYLNEIINYFLQGQDIGIPVPDPSIYLAYEQYVGDLYEIVYTVTLFVAVSIFIRDKTNGLLPLIFSKPISKTQYVLSKYISFNTMMFVGILLGNIAFSYYTYFLFDEVFILEGIYLSLLFFLDVMFISAIAMFSAIHLKSYIPAMLVTWGMYISSGILTYIGSLTKNGIIILKSFPGSIKNHIVYIVHNMSDTSDVIWTIVTTIILIGILLYVSIIKIQDQDI